MTKLTISLPDDLVGAARAAGLIDEWLGRVAALPGTSATHEQALDALDGARVDVGR